MKVGRWPAGSRPHCSAAAGWTRVRPAWSESKCACPGPDTLEVGESIQLAARPLNKDGDSVGTPVTWLSVDPTATIDAATGVLTGVSAGSARVQATVGALGSELITFAVIEPADTLVLTSDSIVTLPADAVTSPATHGAARPLRPRGPGPLAGRGVIYALTSPDPAAGTPTVAPAGLTSSPTRCRPDRTATPRPRLAVVTGSTPPDSAIVTVRAERTRGATGARARGSASSSGSPRRRGTHAEHADRALLRHHRAVRRPPGGDAHPAGRPLDGARLPGARRAGPRRQHRPARAGRAGRRPGGDPVREPAGVGDRRLRLPGRALPPTCRSIPRCPPAGPSTSCATPAPWPSWCRRPHSWRSCWRSASTCRRSATSSRSTRTRAGPDVLPFDEVLACGRAALAPPPGLARPRARRGARRSRHADLHLGHDRRPQGRDADPRQHRLERDDAASTLFAFAEGDECLSFLPLSHIFERMVGHYSMFHAGVLINYAEQHRHGGGATCRRSGRRMMASVPRLYEKIYARVLETPSAAGAGQRSGSSSGPARWARRWVERTLAGAAACRRCWRSSSGWPTGWSSPSCARAPAAGSASSSRAARRSRRRSPSSSSPPGCRSSRATASPRPRR